MKYIFTPTAQDDFDRLTRRERKRIAEKLRFYALQDNPLAHAERLTGFTEYRFRVGDYRVIFEILHGVLWVKAIKRRDECQSAFKFDPGSASNFDPLERRVRAVALAPSELAGVAETARARVVV